MENDISFNAIITEEEQDGNTTFNATCEELGITDFGDTPEEAVNNLKEGLDLLFRVEPSKKEILIRKPIMIKKVAL
ncbi:hypothetical protein CMI38_01410 [Candidatus Pacearchaeota archaeon]|jgi:predicted RNase H-like HicB family nuclease|nr:hypothetical protein [Candidatus Pacearchaeota archaeon]|tara:strand:- start:5072 stop:5299 length:228 start_codon:yes stop_codon:yes gene_type:complete